MATVSMMAITAMGFIPTAFMAFMVADTTAGFVEATLAVEGSVVGALATHIGVAVVLGRMEALMAGVAFRAGAASIAAAVSAWVTVLMAAASMAAAHLMVVIPAVIGRASGKISTPIDQNL